ncbi:MAG: hotdog fold thioesterase [Hymenobacteraceae bacterium]|nr:hotdog fold thioesterase [Hymenobacteraceae bacterium]
MTAAELTARMCAPTTLGGTLGIEITETGERTLTARMPVGPPVHQPMGMLHGGASVALAETVGSLAGWLALPDPARQACVGLEINANHLRPVRDGYVVARAEAVHIGRRTQVWDIRIRQETTDALVCISRLTLAVIDIDPATGQSAG